MRFKTRLVVGHATLLSVTLVIGAAALIAMRTTSTMLESVALDTANDMIAIQRLRFQAEQLVATSRGYLLAGDPETRERFDKAAARVDTTLHQLNRQTDLDVDVQRVERSARTYVAAAQRALELRTTSGDPRTILPFFETTLAPARDEFEDAIQQLVHHEQSTFLQVSADARDFAGRAWIVVILATVFAIVLGLVLAWISIENLNHRYSRERKSNELARRAVDARDELLAIVSHDLRTPLQTISMGAGLLEEDAASPQTRSRLSAILGAADRMQHLIDALLDMARLEHGHSATQRTSCMAFDLVETSANMFRSRAEKAQIELTCRTESKVAVIADRESVLQVLSNLVSNAFRFTPPGGRIALSVDPADRAIRFAVSDTGPGIPQDQVPRLFERYWQGGGSRRGILGLGLYICKKIVDAHGGAIGVETAMGGGSTFWFTLPNSSESAHDPTTKSES